MKKLLLILPFFFFTGMIIAQDAYNAEAVRKAVEEQTALYQLNETQITKMQKIQETRFNNLAEVEHLKDSDYKQYLFKQKSIQMGMNGSIERMLTQEQKIIFNQQRAERRKKESDLIKSLRANGATKEEIQMALLELK